MIQAKTELRPDLEPTGSRINLKWKIVASHSHWEGHRYIKSNWFI